jgi:hypothetical protein
MQSASQAWIEEEERRRARLPRTERERLLDEGERIDRAEAYFNAATRERPLTLEERRDVAAAQRRAEPVYAALSRSRPLPGANEPRLPYAVRVAQDLQKHSDRWATANLVRVARSSPDAFAAAAAEILADATRRGLDWSYSGLPNGGLRERHVTDAAGQSSSVFHGNPADAWAPFTSPARATIKRFWEPFPSRRQIYPR